MLKKEKKSDRIRSVLIYSNLNKGPLERPIAHSSRRCQKVAKCQTECWPARVDEAQSFVQIVTAISYLGQTACFSHNQLKQH